MSSPFPLSSVELDEVEAVLVEPELQRLDGVVREAFVPPLVPLTAYGSLADVPFDNARRAPEHIVLSRRTDEGRWAPMTAVAFAEQVLATAKGLVAAGLAAGDRVAVMSRTTYEWTLLDFAAWAAGLVTVPVHPGSSVHQTHTILQDSGAVALVTETREQAAALAAGSDRRPARVWVVEDGDVGRLARPDARVPTADITVRRGMAGPNTVASIVYTSGTTGHPKACALTHGNFFAQVDNLVELLHPVLRARPGEKPSVLLLLPMSHVFGRLVSVACVRARIRLGHAPSLRPEDLLADLAAFRPTGLFAIPYLLEKVFHVVRARAERGGRAAAFDRGAEVARRFGEARERRRLGTGDGPTTALKAARAFYDPTVYRRIRLALGGRVSHVVCGGSPLPRDLEAFYAGAGIDVLEGYGLTEATGAATVGPPLRPRMGTVGWPLPGTRVRIAEDGEILLAGEHVLKGYWDPRADGLAPAAPDGWLATGDLGRLDDQGYLTITGRKKEVLITRGGRSVAPGPTESRLRAHPLISQCMLVGDARPFVSALITLDPRGLDHWRRSNGRHPVPPALAVDDPELLRLVRRAVDEVNSYVSRPESIRRFTILPVDFTEEAGHLTPAMKLRRERILRDFATEIETLYAR